MRLLIDGSELPEDVGATIETGGEAQVRFMGEAKSASAVAPYVDGEEHLLEIYDGDALFYKAYIRVEKVFLHISPACRQQQDSIEAIGLVVRGGMPDGGFFATA